MSDPELIKRCLKQDKQAWDIFIDRYAKLVYWAIRKRLALSNSVYNQANVEDIFQEIFIAILEDAKLSQLKDPAKLSNWLVTLTLNQTSSFLRKIQNQNLRIDLDMALLRDDSFGQALLTRDELLVIEDVIDNLSKKEKKVISLCLLEGETHKRIGEILKMPVNSVSTVVARAKEKIKKELIKRGIGENF